MRKEIREAIKKARQRRSGDVKLQAQMKDINVKSEDVQPDISRKMNEQQTKRSYERRLAKLRSLLLDFLNDIASSESTDPTNRFVSQPESTRRDEIASPQMAAEKKNVSKQSAIPGTSVLHEPWLTPQEVADSLRTAVRTLAQWRSRRRGPKYLKIGRKIYYPLSWIEEYIADLVTLQAASQPNTAMRSDYLSPSQQRRLKGVTRLGGRKLRREREPDQP